MATFIVKDTGEVLTEANLRQRFSSVIVPSPLTLEWLNSVNIEPVFEGPMPSISSPYEYVYADGIEKMQDGKWYTKYSVGPVFVDLPNNPATKQFADYKKGKDDAQWEIVRRERDTKMKDTDWIVLRSIELGISVPSDWAEYRQALRDVTNQESPFSIQWPTKPV